MPLTSDIAIDATKFHAGRVTEETKQINTLVEGITKKGPQWYEVGITKYRQMRETGDTPLPVPVYLPGALDATLPSREKGRTIPIRVYKPENGQPSKGILLHFHGGGFVLATHKHSDSKLKSYANGCQLTAISVGYRLAPESPYPATIEDCCDAAEYLVDHAENDYGAELLFMGGESAGSCCAAVTAFQLMRSRPAHKLAGLIFPYGQFDLTLNLPQVSSATRPLVINCEMMRRSSDAYVPGMTMEDKRSASVSPLYEDMQALVSSGPDKRLPPALFLVGTEDPLLDDTLLMSMKWMIAGGEAVVKIFTGAPHGFTAFPSKSSAEASEVTMQFVQENLGTYV
jgi:acetyl esterase/lipase